MKRPRQTHATSVRKNGVNIGNVAVSRQSLPKRTSPLRVAVVGGGLAGCCAALELALAGCKVTLYERQPELLSRAAVANEGKLHLGYVYAGDPGLATARRMVAGALSFQPLMRRLLGLDALDLNPSSAFIYAVHRESQIPPDQVGAYLQAVHRLIDEAAHERGSYFGVDLAAPPHVLGRGEIARHYDTGEIVAAFQTPEIAIDPLVLAPLIEKRVREEPAIERRTATEVTGFAETDGKLEVMTRDGGRHRFDRVVNAAWENRLALDATLGLHPPRQWFHRFKYGVRFRPLSPARTPCTTLVLGPFGDVVVYASGEVYMSWYPAGLATASEELVVPYRPTRPAVSEADRLVRGTVEGLCDIVPGLRAMKAADGAYAVRGGQIIAWGQTDIDDPGSGLHARSMIGVSAQGRYFSLDPGKLTTAPFFARRCAEAVLAS
ncbi:MAG: FAD-dependent oxidoreductase [Flavobacteriaceae bacterium]